MGHDITVKNCPTPYSSECRDGECSHEIIDTSYISFNYRIFYYTYNWKVDDFHGYTGGYNSIKLKHVLDKMKKEGIKPEIKNGEDVWTPTVNVYCYILTKLYNLCIKYPSCRFYSDQVFSNPEEIPTHTTNFYFSQPVRGCI